MEEQVATALVGTRLGYKDHIKDNGEVFQFNLQTERPGEGRAGLANKHAKVDRGIGHCIGARSSSVNALVMPDGVMV